MILDELFNPDADEPDIGPFGWIEDLLSENHRDNCQASCTSCIRYYSNMREHGLMDWRLGLSLLRLLNDVNDDVCTNSGNLVEDLAQLGPEHEMFGWLQQAQQQQQAMANLDPRPGIMECMDFAGLPAVIDRHMNLCHIFIHPLWARDEAGVTIGNVMENADEEFQDWALEQGDGGWDGEVNWVDTFNGSRRISWCRSNLQD
jgi:hypothetical protein